ncbi:Bardet-Biedl syndrome 4 protein homolog [Panonychus citri]|uniref:Bardet-Biedl syndrome 4 protein homolog n=1 Tax=Panonychus citri TaxID=50023 RepID=UPI00230721F1|nr:Bardet-Biedl syndrome 4 protein homolog [Panonychus citri]
MDTSDYDVNNQLNGIDENSKSDQDNLQLIVSESECIHNNNNNSKMIPPSAKSSGMSSSIMTTVKPPSNELRSKESYNWLLHLHYVRGEYNYCCEQINRIDCSSEYSWYLKGLISLRDKGNVKEALSFFNHIKSLSNVYYIKAVIRCLLLLGRHTEVSEVIRETGLQMAQNDWQLWLILGNCYLHSGNISLAKDAYQHSLQNANTVEPFLLLAQCHTIEGDTKSAIFVLRRATEISPDSIPVAIRLGQLLMESDMRSKGIEKFIQLNQMTMNLRGNLDLSLAVGSILQETRGDIEGALYKYKLSECYESPSIWNNVALCFAARKKYVAAVSCLKRAIYLNPLDHRINYNLGLISLQLRQFASGFHFFKTSCALAKSSTSNVIFSLLGVCLESLSDDINARQAHITATKNLERMVNFSPIPLINYAVYLYNKDQGECKDMIMELLMTLEQFWLNKKQQQQQGNTNSSNNSSGSLNEFEETFMSTATKLSTLLNINSHMAWARKDEVESVVS